MVFIVILFRCDKFKDVLWIDACTLRDLGHGNGVIQGTQHQY